MKRSGPIWQTRSNLSSEFNGEIVPELLGSPRLRGNSQKCPVYLYNSEGARQNPPREAGFSEKGT
jgi:hypothetical protein